MEPKILRGIAFLQRNVRRGFLMAVLGGTSIIGSTLWATIAMLPYFPGPSQAPLNPTLPVLTATRAGVPAELAWFFIQFPYLSSDIHIRAKNHHTFMVNDPARRREYVITLGQSYRRVEIYFGDDKDHSTVQILTPGRKRVVEFKGVAVLSDVTKADSNLWMWQSPLWNSLHLKIYALADFWLDTPYKKFSCAGFVQQFLGEAGVKMPILDAWDIAKQHWVRVPVDEMEPGDIITIRAGSPAHQRFWKHRITHVGVYLGNGKMIHAATSSAKAKRSYVRIVSVEQFHDRIDKILRPPDLL
jgi:cell wall-associated NlpC family hydrolase